MAALAGTARAFGGIPPNARARSRRQGAANARQVLLRVADHGSLDQLRRAHLAPVERCAAAELLIAQLAHHRGGGGAVLLQRIERLLPSDVGMLLSVPRINS